MKRILVMLGCLSPLLALAAQYSIGWYKIGGGGGACAGGPFQVHGTVGQSDASAALSGGQYSVIGGFWSLISVVQTPGAPLLTVTYAAGQAIVACPSSAAGWTLQTNNSLAGSAWGDYLGPVINHSVTNSPPSGNLFFRLRQ